MKLNKILIATGNKGKFLEFQKYFSTYNITCISLSGYNIEEPEENGKSFEENAYIKAKYYCNITKLPALADDSGLSIDQLDGMPGIYSARWAGDNKDFSSAIKKIESKLNAKNTPLDNLSGFFYCALSLMYPNQQHHSFTGKVCGKITFPARGNKGFGYDPIFIPNIPNHHNINKTFGEMTFEEKQKYTHRTQALDKLQKYLLTI